MPQALLPQPIASDSPAAIGGSTASGWSPGPGVRPFLSSGHWLEPASDLRHLSTRSATQIRLCRGALKASGEYLRPPSPAAAPPAPSNLYLFPDIAPPTGGRPHRFQIVLALEPRRP